MLTMLVSRTDMNTPAIRTTSGSPQPLAAAAGVVVGSGGSDGGGSDGGGVGGGWDGGARRSLDAVETSSVAVPSGPPEARFRDSDTVVVSAWSAGISSIRPRVRQQTASAP